MINVFHTNFMQKKQFNADFISRTLAEGGNTNVLGLAITKFSNIKGKGISYNRKHCQSRFS